MLCCAVCHPLPTPFNQPLKTRGGNILTLPDVTTRATYAATASAGAQYGLMLWSIHKTGCPSAQQITSAACTAFSMPGCSTPLPQAQSSCGTPPPTPTPSPPPPSPPPSNSPSPSTPPTPVNSPAPSSPPTPSGGGCSSYTGMGGACGATNGGMCCPNGQCCSQYGECLLVCFECR
jgi:hypothetical protein